MHNYCHDAIHSSSAGRAGRPYVMAAILSYLLYSLPRSEGWPLHEQSFALCSVFDGSQLTISWQLSPLHDVIVPIGLRSSSSPLTWCCTLYYFFFPYSFLLSVKTCPYKESFLFFTACSRLGLISPAEFQCALPCNRCFQCWLQVAGD